jgi:hypothetical protein
MGTRTKVSNSAASKAIRSKAIQMAIMNPCGHCGIVYKNVKQHSNICLMNPNRKTRNGAVKCSKCSFDIPSKNIARHLDICSGSIEETIDAILQVYRSDYLRILRGGEKFNGAHDRNLGYGKRAVPEVVRANVENDLMNRGMPSDWAISPTLRVIKPATAPEIIDITEIVDDDLISAVVDLIVDERTLAEVLNQIINLATYKLATR